MRDCAGKIVLLKKSEPHHPECVRIGRRKFECPRNQFRRSARQAVFLYIGEQFCVA